MAVLSKQLFNLGVKNMQCPDLYHPWSQSCIKSYPKIVTDSFIGSTRFYSLIYLIQIVLQGKKLKHVSTWEKLGEFFIRSVMFGAGVPITCLIITCIFSAIGIRKSYLTTLLIPFTLNGLFIYLEPPNRRSLVVNLFFNLIVEYCLRCLSRSGYIEMTKSKQTFLFMIGSAFLFYLMRLEGDKDKRTPLLWLFTAEKVKRETDDNKSYCPHKGLCWKYILKGCGTYFGIGLGISLAKLILPRIRRPMKAMSSIRGKHFKLALFFSSYIGIYRAVICYLCRKKKRDSALYALPAGCLAGLSMIFSPSSGMAIASVTGAAKLYTTILYEKKILPEDIPLPEMMYCICQGILFSARVVDPEACPPYIRNLVDTVSHGHSQDMCRRVLERSMRIQAT